MSRFAVLLDRRRDGHAARHVETELTRRSGTVTASADDGLWLWQAGAASPRHAGPLTLVADLALTDQDALRSALGAGPQADQADLVLAAWLRWGMEALDHLNGSFAFALWDRRTRCLTAVRDRFGIRPLAYALTPHGAILAGDLAPVLAGLDHVPDIEPAWVADFLSGTPLDMTSTAWNGVLRLPPGHLMTLNADGIATLRCWYRLQASAPPASGDAGPALRAALAHATAQACAGQPTATMLSGGLDSSTLALMSVQDGGMADPRPALSLRYRDPALDEGAYIDAVLQASGGRLAPVFLPGETQDADLFDLEAQLAWQDQPVFAPGLDRNHRLYRGARDQNCGAVLDGHGGDEVIGGTFRDIALLARGRDWPRALGLAVRHARFTGIPVAEAIAALLAARGRHGFGRLGRGALAVLAPDRGASAQSWSSLVDPDLAQRTRMVERLRDLDRPDPRDRHLPQSLRLHAAVMAGPLSALAFETLDRAAQAEGMQVHYPFYDHRVAELCVWQPAAAKVAKGRPRALLRAATRGLLPDAVRLRRDKTDFLSGFWAALRRDPQGRLAALGADHGPLRGWVDAATLHADGAVLARSPEPDPQVAFRLWRALCLAAWLDRNAAHSRHSPAVASIR